MAKLLSSYGVIPLDKWRKIGGLAQRNFVSGWVKLKLPHGSVAWRSRGCGKTQQLGNIIWSRTQYLYITNTN
jgi:hypothetical protein